MTRQLQDRVEELENMVMLQQGQILALLTLELARIGQVPAHMRTASAALSLVRETEPEHGSAVGVGFLAVVEALEEAIDQASAAGLQDRTEH